MAVHELFAVHKELRKIAELAARVRKAAELRFEATASEVADIRQFVVGHAHQSGVGRL